MFTLQGQKHLKKSEARSSSEKIQKFLTTQPSSGTTLNSAVLASTSSSTSTADVPKSSITFSFIRPETVTRAELIYQLAAVKIQASARGTGSMASLFPSIFPDSDIAKNFKLGRTKSSYILCFGIAPFLENKLILKLKASDEFVMAFDEATNKIAQRAQMDFIVRFWDPSTHRIETKYFGSAFLGHTTAATLLESFREKLSDIGLKKLLSVSMDGPNVNWKFLTDLTTVRSSEGFPNLLNAGCCGLHVVHGAVGVGHKASGWMLLETFGYAYYLFKDSPARRDDFRNITKSTIFPLKFCRVRWCENVSVAKRFLQVLDDLATYCEQVKPKPKVSSFRGLVEAIKDTQLRAKVHFFISICSVVKPFLRKFQSASPLMPFLFDELVQVNVILAQR